MSDWRLPAESDPHGSADPSQIGSGTPAPADRWHVWVAGQVYGPADVREIRQWSAEGRLQPGWQVQPVGGDVWLSPTAVPELQDIQTLASPLPRTGAFHVLAPQLDQAPAFGDVLRRGWELWLRHVGWGVFLMVFQGVLVLGPMALPLMAIFSLPSGAWPDEPFDARWLLGIAAGVLCLLLLPPVGLGATTCAIDTARHDQGTLIPLLSGFRQWSSAFVPMTLLLLVSLIPYVGYLMIFVTPIYTIVYCILADRQRGLIDAFRQLPSLLAGRYWWIFLLTLVADFIGGAGALLLGVGLLFTGPLQYLITSLVYLDLAAREGWSGSERTTPTGVRLAVEVIPMIALTVVLLGGLVVIYLVWWS